MAKPFNDMRGEPVFSLPTEQVYEFLGSSPNGLSPEEAEKRLSEFGPNEIKEARKTPLGMLFLSNFVHFFALLLWVAAGLAFIGGLPELGWAVIAVIFINGIFSFWQEYKAEKATEALKKLLPLRARVMRNGEEQSTLASELVPGDVVLLAEGERISADMRLVEAFQLRTDNSTLTGESVPVPKVSDPVMEKSIPLTEVPNIVFAGTSAVTGTGKGVVFATGMTTQFGQIANLTQTVEEEPSPLQKEMSRVTKIVAMIAVSLGVVFFVLGTLVGLPLIEGFLFAVGVIVANVPEGLLPTVTLALAVGVQRMARHHALVKKLSSVETLGSCTVICTDKTGTLTQNEMTVTRIWAGFDLFDVSGVGYEPKGTITRQGEPVSLSRNLSLKETLKVATFSNNARLLPPNESNPHWIVVGDPTEAALLVAALKANFDYVALRRENPRIFELAFESIRKRMSTIHVEDGLRKAYVKGAPREVLALCQKVMAKDGKIIDLTEEMRQQIILANDDFAREGLRVLAMASREVSSADGPYTVESVEHALTFNGLMAMMDPPRPEVSNAVREAHSAGIRVVMITGDYGLTAESIARKIGIIASENPRIVTGAELDQISEPDLRTLLYAGEVIFARVTPAHKLRVVGAFRESGEIVAVTGDGVNDAPALKKADIGVAMGITGTDVAKEASELILTDDNFATIVAAIEQGRAVYDNIKKFVTYIFASNIPELVPFLAFVILGIPLPLTVMQILAVDLGTDMVPALALGTEAPEPGVMGRPPRSQKRPLLDLPLLLRAYGFLGVIEAIAAMSGFFWVYYSIGWRPGDIMVDTGYVYQLATTMTFACIVASQIGNAFATRTERVSVFRFGFFSNRLLLIGILVEIVLLLILSYVPFLHGIFNTAPLRPEDFLFLMIWPPFILGAEELRKALVRRYRSAGGTP